MTAPGALHGFPTYFNKYAILLAPLCVSTFMVDIPDWTLILTAMYYPCLLTFLLDHSDSE